MITRGKYIKINLEGANQDDSRWFGKEYYFYILS